MFGFDAVFFNLERTLLCCSTQVVPLQSQNQRTSQIDRKYFPNGAMGNIPSTSGCLAPPYIFFDKVGHFSSENINLNFT